MSEKNERFSLEKLEDRKQNFALSMAGSGSEVKEFLGDMAKGLPDPFAIAFTLLRTQLRESENIDVIAQGGKDWAEVRVRVPNVSSWEFIRFEEWRERSGYHVIEAYTYASKTILVKKDTSDE